MSRENSERKGLVDQQHLGYYCVADDLYCITEIQKNPQATDKDEILGAKGRFGHEPTNPIPIQGIPNSKVYMGKLRLMDGSPILWVRQGSMRVPRIKCPVDIYEIYDLKSTPIAMLYVSAYHLKSSEKAPEGFVLIDDPFDDFSSIRDR